MVQGHNRRAVGVFSKRRDAEDALQELKDAGFQMDKVSLIAKNVDGDDRFSDANVRDIDDDTKADDGAKKGAIAGGAVGGLTGLLVGLGALAIPGIGPVMLAGATATALATALSGGAIGAAAGGLIGGLIGLGIPEDRARVYSDRVSHGDYLVMVDGTEDEIRRAEAILSRRGIQEWGIYDHPGVDTSDADYTTGAVGRRDNVGNIDDRVVVIDRRDEVL